MYACALACVCMCLFLSLYLKSAAVITFDVLLEFSGMEKFFTFYLLTCDDFLTRDKMIKLLLSKIYLLEILNFYFALRAIVYAQRDEADRIASRSM